MELSRKSNQIMSIELVMGDKVITIVRVYAQLVGSIWRKWCKVFREMRN